ncbi:MAG: hypothetical protein PHI27_06905 [Eubacteriales bacterium]|nr:hypothetical protein [Eubacteriales bacterium]MDD3881964.1 hypothetical protein [Eubacteriales bacterium]MDD4513135.1 hypothetical protein [Eubacteriales bacterium]
MKRFTLTVLLMLILALASGCALLPTEEVFEKAPVDDSDDTLPYTFVTVERGDLALTQSLYCVYGSVRTQNLAFPMDGGRIVSVLCTAGDAVTEGQLLASVELEPVYERLKQIETEERELELSLSYIDVYEKIEIERAKILYAGDSSGKSDALTQISEEYERQRTAVYDKQSCLEIEKTENNEKIKQGELRAPFDGTITYARANAEETLTNKEYTMFTVVDSARALFSADTEYWDYFTPGQQVQVVMLSGSPVYDATVVNEAELGKPETEKVHGQKAMVYFELNEPVYNLEYDDHAYVELTIDSRQNALIVNTRALVDMGDKKIAYYIDPVDGLKKYKVIEIGLVASLRAEVISGLAEGEQIILK